MSADKNLYRVWPDGWVQDASEEPPTWRSDDFVILAAEDEDAALAEFERRDADARTGGLSLNWAAASVAELRRLHAENAALQQGYDAARLEIGALRSRQCLHGISEPSGWMPIETAPKDGTLIVLGSRNGVWIGKYLPLYGSGYRPDNPWSSMLLNHDHMAERYTWPTHWMPLPPPPTTSAGSGKGE